ncbi:MAG: F0F1 ATP synthase subunit delta [Gammaproteobacteria bacterium]
MSARAARPYAAAAFDFAKAKGALDSWDEMFATLAASADAVRAAARACPGGELPLAEALAELLELQDEAQKNFLRIAAENRRLGGIGDIARQFAEMHLESQNIAAVRVESAHPMDGKAQQEFNKFLARKFEREVRAEYAENPALLGGVRAYWKDNVLDASVRGRLDRLSAALS